MDLKYRPDIDGLRAIAVLAVLFFHTKVPGFSGGFVGVDIFFVISGYLITSIILKDIRENRFSIARFYERRIRRIFPALFPVMVFVLAVGAYLFDQSAFKNLGESITATTLFSSNIVFWRESGYFDAPSLEKPLLHTWSLAVEEQFYIVFPIVLMLIGRYMKGRYVPLVLAAFVLSFVASVYGVTHYPGATFYLVPTRAWELLTGSLLALGVFPAPSSSWQKNLGAIVGLAFIFGSIVSYTEDTPFPGLAALLPVLGSGLVIHSGRGGGTYLAQKTLKARPLVFVGLISYSLYLWHWPLVAFWKYLLFREFSWIDSAGIIIASFILASFSWKFIEQPFRGKGLLIPERKKLFSYSVIITIIFSSLGALIYSQQYLNNLHPVSNCAIKQIKNDPISEYEKWDEIIRKIDKGVSPPIIGKKEIQPTFALWGDSNARALIPAINKVAQEHQISGYSLVHTATPPLIGIDRPNFKTDNYNISRTLLNQNILSFIKQYPKIKTVFLAGAWSLWTNNVDGWFDINREMPNNMGSKLLVKEGLMRTIRALLLSNRKVVVIAMVPELSSDLPRYSYLRSRFYNVYKNRQIGTTMEYYDKRNDLTKQLMEDFHDNSNVIFIHPEKILFVNNSNSISSINGKLLYRDERHLSTFGSIFVAPVFNEVFRQMAADQMTIHALSAVQ